MHANMQGLVLVFFGAVVNFADKSIVGLAAAQIMNELDLSFLITGFGWKVAFASLGIISLIWAIVFLFTKETPPVEYEGAAKKKKEKMRLKDVGLILTSPTALYTTLAYFSTYILVVWFSVWLPSCEIANLAPLQPFLFNRLRQLINHRFLGKLYTGTVG